MSAAADTPARSRTPAARAIRAILILQLGMAAVLFGSDMIGTLPGLGFGPATPSLDRPVAPGDQTRRFDPTRLPTLPGDSPVPATTDMPDRLRFAGTETLTLTGTIAPGDAERFAKHLETLNETPEAILLNSPGGSVHDALQIGRLLREKEMSTALGAGDICLSACPYILAAGTERQVDTDAWVGVHQHYFQENPALPAFLIVEDIQSGQGEVMAYLDEMGVDPLLMKHALVTPPEDIYIFVREELELYRIVTDGES